LIMPVEEMTTSVVVKDFQHCVKCVVQLWKRGCISGSFGFTTSHSRPWRFTNISPSQDISP
jgi:hypothetical protein